MTLYGLHCDMPLTEQPMQVELTSSQPVGLGGWKYKTAETVERLQGRQQVHVVLNYGT